jgi:hypothetical protein
MSLIKVGIHENLTFSKAVINDKGTLELGIKTVEDPDALLNAFEGSGTFDKMESSFRFYPPSMKDFDQVPKDSAALASEILKMRHQFIQYARLFATKEDVEDAIGGLNMFNGLGIPPEDIKKALAQFTNEDFLKNVVTNLGQIFADFLAEKNAFSGSVLFRHKFIRQSKAKNFATIPNSDFDVWVESMDIPSNASKISYSEWELKNGKDNPDPVASSDADTTVEDANKASALFSAEADDAQPAL